VLEIVQAGDAGAVGESGGAAVSRYAFGSTARSRRADEAENSAAASVPRCEREA